LARHATGANNPGDDKESMMSAAPDLRTNSRVIAAWRARTPGSAELARQAATLLPSGIAHDARYVDPYGPYITRAAGPHKWDVDGNRYVDFYGGHGALILGHCHPEVTRRVAEAAALGTQYGACHPLEIDWARAIQRLVPSAERVRFTSSGTEATLMAVRLARAFTGRSTLVRFKGHFHGWHDHMTSGHLNHFDGSPTPGVLSGIAARVALAPPGDAEAVEAILAGGDVAAVIVEPTGSSFGSVPLKPEFIRRLRELTTKYGALLILDEVITGFRVSPGGAQVAFGVTPDLSTFAKIVAGGMPGGAVAGRRDVLDQLDFVAMAQAGREKIAHPGTFNANPVSAAAGIAALTVIAESDINTRADEAAAALREALNAVLAEERVNWAVYGTSSGFHLFMNPQNRPCDPRRFDPYEVSFEEMKTQPAALANKLRVALLLHGVDVNGRIAGFTSATHTASDVADTATAFRDSLRMLREEGDL
jgi:glutamate-1-semialdehyde 2,1-aminomutase